jgi:hypothetical protein
MFVNSYQINLSTLSSGTTATTINLPVSLEYQLVDQEEMAQTKFVDVEVKKNINPVIDYERIRFTPLDLNDTEIEKIIYEVTFVSGNTYADIGFTNEDIKFRRENFKQSFLNLNFYDSDNPLTQNLITNITLYSRLKSSDLIGFDSSFGSIGTPKPVDEIQVEFVLENPIFIRNGNYEGFFIYNFKDILNVGEETFLYMKATFNNAKNGKSTNMMVKDTPQDIDMLIHEQYTRFKLFRTNDGYYYKIDNEYQGNDLENENPLPNNVTYTTNDNLNSITVNLFEILTT